MAQRCLEQVEGQKPNDVTGTSPKSPVGHAIARASRFRAEIVNNGVLRFLRIEEALHKALAPGANDIVDSINPPHNVGPVP